MPDAAGKVSIVLSIDKATFSQGLDEAQRQLDIYKGKVKGTGAAHVSSMQASSAAIRTLEGDWTRNTRAVEKFITMIPGVSQALKVMFPLVGGIAFASLIGEMGVKVVDFIKKANAMPQAIRDGFAALNLQQKTSIDSLNVMTDKLREAHAAFEHRPGNGTKTAIDEAKESADKFAAACVAANAKVEELLSKNSSGLLSALLLGKPMTGGVEKDFAEYQRVQSGNSYAIANAGNDADRQKAQQAYDKTLHGFITDQQGKLAFRQAQGGAVGADAEGVLSALLDEVSGEQASKDNAVAQGQAAKDEAAKKASEQAKEAAAKQVQAMQAGLNALKLQYNVSVKAEYDYWDARRNAFTAGSTAYNEIVAKQAELAVAGARSAHEQILKIQETQKRNDGELAPDWQRAMDAWNKQTAAERDQSIIDANTGAIDEAQNKAKTAEADIAERVGKSLTQFDAAVQLANIHTTEYVTTLGSLQGIVDTRAAAAKVDPSVENQRSLATATKALADAMTNRGIQIGKDSINVNGQSTSGLVGAEDALRDFVQASRDAATQMRDLVNNTLHDLNTQLLSGITGQRTNFKGVGQGLARNIANVGLQKAEGSILGAMGLGGGKLGTKSNPMHVIMDGAGAAGKAVGAVANAVGTTSGSVVSKLGGFFGTMLKSVLPGLADGGFLNGPAIVGENGPELFVPSVAGNIVPNYKLSAGSSGGDIHFHPGAIDARGSSDPAQVEAAVHRAIAQAAPHIMAGSVNATREAQKRRPSRSA